MLKITIDKPLRLDVVEIGLKKWGRKVVSVLGREEVFTFACAVSLLFFSLALGSS